MTLSLGCGTPAGSPDILTLPHPHCAEPGQASEVGWLPWQLQLQPSQEAGTAKDFILNSRKGRLPGPSLGTGTPERKLVFLEIWAQHTGGPVLCP